MMAPAARRSQRDPGNAQIIARRFTPHSRCLLDSTQGPPKPSQRDHLFASLFAQDISHPTEANGPRRKLCLDLFAMAGFQVTLYGRFWVTAKVIEICDSLGGHARERNRRLRLRSWRHTRPSD